jgi:hypothetical protein
VADATLKAHGDQAPIFVATRIGALTLAGDAHGVLAWQEIARRMVKLSAVRPPDLAC